MTSLNINDRRIAERRKEEMRLRSLSLASDGIPRWINIIYKVGVPSAIALYLVYTLATKVNDNLVQINHALETHASETLRNANQTERIYYLLRTICVNGAKNAYDRNECLK